MNNQELDADAYIRMYCKEAGTKVSYEMTYPHMLNLHAIIGACLQGNEGEQSTTIKIRGHILDLRVHPFIIQSSGSGKALSYTLAEQLADRIGLDWKTRTQLTEAGLVGTLLKKGSNVIPIYGDAKDTDILGFTEAHSVLKHSSTSKTMMETLNMILDTKAEIHKRLAYGTIDYKTRVSLVMSSFPSALVHEQLQKGFLQRCFIYYQYIPTEHYKRICQWLAKYIGVNETEKVGEYLDIIAERLRQIRDRHFEFEFTDKAREMLNTIAEEITELVKGYFEIEVLKTFTPRYFNLACKLASHHASLELRNTITEKDMEYAKMLCLTSLRSVCEFVMAYTELNKGFRKVERFLDKFRSGWKCRGDRVDLSKFLKYTNLKKERALRLLEPYVVRKEIELEDKKETSGTWIIFIGQKPTAFIPLTEFGEKGKELGQKRVFVGGKERENE